MALPLQHNRQHDQAKQDEERRRAKTHDGERRVKRRKQTPARDFQEAEDHAEQADDGQDDAGQIEHHFAFRFCRRRDQEGAAEDDDAQAGDSGKRGAPAEVVNQQAANQRAGGEGDAASCADSAKGDRLLAAFIVTGDKPQHRRDHKASANTGKQTGAVGEDQHVR